MSKLDLVSNSPVPCPPGFPSSNYGGRAGDNVRLHPGWQLTKRPLGVEGGREGTPVCCVFAFEAIAGKNPMTLKLPLC